MSDLDKLIAAVEAGEGPGNHALYFDDLDHVKWCIDAWRNDLNAALRLHEALLPGWAWEGGSFSSAMSVYPPFYPGEDFDAPCYIGENANLPRALLLAILRALKAKGEP